MAKNDAIVERLLAYAEIGQLAARYAVAVDARDLDALVALYVEDVHVSDEQIGRGALREWFDRWLRDSGVTIHNVGTHVIEFDDADHARGVVYCRGEVQIGERWVVQAIQYRDAYARRNGHWYFVRRRHLMWYGRDVGTNPIGLPTANWPERHSGWGELPDASPTWAAFWAGDPPTH